MLGDVITSSVDADVRHVTRASLKRLSGAKPQ
jgi:hypothetical protein